MTLELVPCPLCSFDGEMLPLQISAEDQHIRDYGELYAGRSVSEWKACGRCGFVHQNPRPSTAALNAFYDRGEYHAPRKTDPHLLLWLHRHAYTDNVRSVMRWTGMSRGIVADLGCGYGIALHEFEKHGWTCYGVEPDAGRVDFARSELKLSGVRRGLVDRELHFPEPVDVVISHHAFEHFADLTSVMEGICNVVKPGGYFFARVPTYFKNRSRMSILYMNAGHYSMFTHMSLSQMLVRHGFEPVQHTYLNKAGVEMTDDLLLLARYTGVPGDPARYYESARAVQHYVNHENPRRTRLYAPIYSVRYKRIAERLRLPTIAYGLQNPRAFARKLAEKAASLSRS